MSVVVFVRHGETAHNKEMVITSEAPGAPLTPLGHEQASTAAADVAPFAPSALFSSPLLRAQQTATVVGKAIRLEVETRPELAECLVGDLEGASSREAFERFDSTWKHWYIRKDIGYALGPNGESGRMAIDRFLRFLEFVRSEHPDETIAAVTHQAFLQVGLAWTCENLAPAFGFQRWLPNCGVAVVRVDEKGVSCLRWNNESF